MSGNVHWQIDVNEGRFMGAATVARLHAECERHSINGGKNE
jgi:hypothetical protein